MDAVALSCSRRKALAAGELQSRPVPFKVKAMICPTHRLSASSMSSDVWERKAVLIDPVKWQS